MNPFSYLEIKNQKQGQPLNEGRNLKVTLDILTQMHYQDFNEAGDKKQKFNPLDLLDKSRSTGSDVEDLVVEDKNSSRIMIEEEEVDDFTKKRLPKDEDFVAPPKTKSKKNLKAPPKSLLLNDYQEKIHNIKT